MADDGVRPDAKSVGDVLKSSHALWPSYTYKSNLQNPAEIVNKFVFCAEPGADASVHHIQPDVAA